MAKTENAIWYERKRTLFGLPLSFTKYWIIGERLFISKGLFNTKEEEIKLYRILDITLNRSLGEKIFGLGTLHLCSADKSTPELDIARIKRPREIRDLISELVEKVRDEKGIISREYLDDEMGH